MFAIDDIGRMSAYADIVLIRNSRDFGAAVKDARLRRGLTQAELADQIGVSRQWVIALERGKSTAELGAALRTLSALGMVVDVVPEPPDTATIDLDRLLGGNQP
jgi:HTH-type transcriptional regulator/antitoxin HipB